MTEKESAERILIALLRHPKWADIDPETICRYARHMAQILSRLCEDPSAPAASVGATPTKQLPVSQADYLRGAGLDRQRQP